MITVYFIEEIPKCQEKMDDSPIFCPLPRLRHPTKRYNWAGLIHINPPTHSHYFCAASLYRGGGIILLYRGDVIMKALLRFLKKVDGR